MSTPGDLLGALGREARARLGGRSSESEARVYRARTVEELIPRIQRELGPDAIVVRRREGLTGGFLGFFQHPWVEIEAIPPAPTVDVYDSADSAAPPAPAQPAPPLAPPATAVPSPPAAPAWPPAAVPPQTAAWPPQPGYAAYGAVPPSSPPIAPPPVAPPPGGVLVPGGRAGLFAQEPGAGSAYVTAHLAALARANRERFEERALFAQADLLPPPSPLPVQQQPYATEPPPLVPQPARPVAQPPVAQPPVAPVPPEPTFERSMDFNELLPSGGTRRQGAGERRTVPPGSGDRARAGVEKGLERYGVSSEMAEELIGAARAHVLPLSPRSGLAAAVRKAIEERIPVAPALPRQGAAIVLVGAGGAGKTTCCAALLKAYRESSTLPAAFATVLREPVHGELQVLLHPLLVRPAPLDSPRAVRALRKARGEGLVVIDTPRLSPSDRGGIKRLGRMLAELAPERIVVTVPATLGRGAAIQLLEALGPLQANAMAVTHADETDQMGVAVEASWRFGLAPEFMLDRAQNGGWRLTRLDPSDLAAMVLR